MVQHSRFTRHAQRLERTLRWLVCLALIVGWLQPAAALARDPDQTALPVRPAPEVSVPVEEAAEPQAPQAPEAVGIVVTKADQLSFDPDSDGLADVNDGIRYTVGITNSGDTDATGVNFSDTIDSLTTLVAGSVRVTPLAGDDAFAAIGNTMLYVGVAKLANTPAKELTGNLFDNDREFLGDTFTLQGFSASSANGGAVTVNSNGSFIYLPPTGFTGTDSFTYTIVDSGGLTSQATVTITVAERVWYVDSNAFAGGTGRSTTPFNTMAAAQTASGVNDYIFVNTGSGSYGAITLKNGQQLIGRGVDLIVSGFTLLAAGSAPTISAAGTLVTLAQNNTVRGLNINSQAGGLGISGTNFGTATINSVSMNGGPALTLATGTLNGTLSNLTSAGGATGVSLTGVNGSLNVTAGSLSNISGTDFLISGGNIAVTYPGSITNSAGRSIQIENHATGAITFSGSINDTGAGLLVQSNTSGTITFSNATKTFNTGASKAITLNSNTGTTILFTGGGLNVSTTTAMGIDVLGGGTLEISGNGNTINTTGNTAFSMSNTTIHANDIVFQSISANGAGTVRGIVLINVGTESFTVTGTGTTDGSGGTIQNTTRGADIALASNVTLRNMNFTNAASVDGDAASCTPLTNTSCNAAINLSGGSGFVLDNLNLTGTMQYGINANGSSNITLQNSSLTGCGNGVDESCVRWVNLGGTSSISASSITNAAARSIWIYNTAGSYTLNVSNVTLDNTIASANGAANLQVSLFGNAVGTVNVTGSTITRHKTDGINVGANDNSTANLKVQTSTIGTTTDDGIGINLGAISTAKLNFNIDDNPVIYGKGNGANPIVLGAFDSSVINGSIKNNDDIEQFVTAGGHTIFLNLQGDSRSTVEILNNVITNGGGGNPIAVDKTALATNRADVTIVGNTITNAGGAVPSTAGIRLRALGNNTICGDVRTNTVNNVNVGVGSLAFNVRANTSTGTARIELEGFNTNAATTWINNGNTPADPNAVVQGGNGVIGAPLAGTCATPTGIPALVAEPQAAAPDAAPVESADSAAETAAPAVEPAETASAQAESAPQAAVQASRAALAPEAPSAGETVSLTIGTLPAGKSITIFFDVTLGGPIPAGKEFVSNQATVSGSNFANVLSNDPGTPTANDPTLTPIDAAPNLGVTKTDGGISTTPGGTVAYTLTYTNTGTQASAGVVITETVPANTFFNAGASTAGWVCAPNNSPGSSCTLPVGGLNVNASGSATFAVNVVNPVAAGVEQISNTASIGDNGASGPDLVPGNNSGSDTTPVIAQPQFFLMKSDSGASVAPGGTVVYSLSYRNEGNQGATGVRITETVPLHTSFNSGSSSTGWVCAPNNNAGSTCTINIGSVTGGGVGGSVNFAVTVINPVPAGVTQITNTASIGDNGANGADPIPANNTASDTTPLNATPDLTIAKSDGGASVAPGNTVVYTLTYANVGNQGATGVTLSETVPANTTFNAGASSAGWVCAPTNNAGSTCTLTVGSLNAGANGTRTFAVTVANPVAAGVSQISNTATIADDGANGADPTPGNNSSTDTTPITAAPDLTITKTDGGITTSPGNTVAYTLSFANVGNQGASGVTLSETVPANTTFNPGASSAGWSCAPNNNAGSTCTISIGTVNVGSNATRVFAVTVANPVAAGVNQISNTATIADDGTNGADLTPSDNSGSDTTPLNAAPDLRLTKSDGGISAGPLDVIAYTLSITNTGNQGAAGVVITETVPLHTSFNAAASSPGWSCANGAPAGTICVITVGGLNAGGSASRTFAVTVVDPLPGGVNQTTNTATVNDNGANGVDPTPANNSGSDTTPLSASPDLAITKSDGGASVAPGGTVIYTLSFANSGTRAASGVRITETVPLHTVFNPASSSPGWVCTPNGNAGSTCTIDVGTVNGRGGSGTRTFAVTVVNPVAAGVTQISNTATIGDNGAGGPDANPADNSGSDTTPVTAAPDLTITKSDGGISTAPGGTVVYTLSYTNTGNQAAIGVTLSETVPANTTFNPGASTAGWNCAPTNNAGSVCTFTVGNLNGGGASGSATFAVTVVNPVAAGVTQISNTATITDNGANGADPTPGNNTAGDTTPLDAAPDLRLTKSDGGKIAVPGEIVSYSLVYSNTGNQGAVGVVLTETVPDNATFNPGASAGGWTCVPNNNPGSTCTITIGTLAGGGGSGNRTFAVTVNNPVAAGVTQINNTASIADNGANGADPTPANNSASDTTPINAVPALTLRKSDGGVSVAPGGTVAYTLSYTNTGNQGASGVRITETVPLHTVFNPGASTAGWICAPNNNAGAICSLLIGGLNGGASGSATFAVTVVNPVPAGVEQISNSATIRDDGGNSPAPVGSIASDTTPVTAAPDLRITKTDGGISTAPGQLVIYTLNITNTGNQSASGVVITETVPDNTTYASGGWSCAPNNNAGSTCTRSIGSLAGGGGNVTVSFGVTVANPVASGVTQISNTASVADDGASGPDSNSANNSGSDTTPLTAAPAFALGKSDGGASVAPGGTVAYTLNITNTGNQVASGVVLTETVPANTTFNAGASTAGWNCAPSGNTGSTCTLSVGSVASTASAIFAVTVDSPVPAGVTQISNSASVADDGSNGPLASASASDTTPLNITLDLSISKSVNPTIADSGNQIVYTIRFTSTGNTIAEGVRITDTLPAQVTISLIESSGVPLTQTSNAPTLAWLAAPMAPGATGIITLTGTVNGGITTEQDVVNTVTIAHPQETAPANNTGTATFTINLPPTANAGGPYTVNEGSTVVLSAAGSSDPGNDTLSYAWDLDNNGSYEAAGVSVTFSNTADNGVFTVGLQVTDTEGASATTTTTVNVLNVAPSVNAGPDRTTTPNQTLTFAGSFTDPGVLDTHTIAWDFGDGGSATGTLSPTHAFSLPGTYTVTLTVTDDDNGVGTDTLRVVVANNRVYLPLITRAQPAPDLVVQNVTTTGTSISVVIRNQGDAPVTDAFWVDLYLNPNPPPTAVNQIWPALSQYGMVWGITQNALPLQPGQSLTLTTRGTYFRGDLSQFPATIPTGTRIYVQVDSANSNTTYGAVLESHERDGLAYNNVFGPRVTTQGITIPAAREDAAQPDAALPQRPAPANR